MMPKELLLVTVDQITAVHVRKGRQGKRSHIIPCNAPSNIGTKRPQRTNLQKEGQKREDVKLHKSPSSLSLQHVRSARNWGDVYNCRPIRRDSAPNGDCLLDLRTSVEEHFSLLQSITGRERERERDETRKSTSLSVSLYASSSSSSLWKNKTKQKKKKEKKKKILFLSLLLFSIHYTRCFLFVLIPLCFSNCFYDYNNPTLFFSFPWMKTHSLENLDSLICFICGCFSCILTMLFGICCSDFRSINLIDGWLIWCFDLRIRRWLTETLSLLRFCFLC